MVYFCSAPLVWFYSALDKSHNIYAYYTVDDTFMDAALDEVSAG